MKEKYHVQVAKAQRVNDVICGEKLEIIRGITSETKHLVVESENLTDAKESAKNIIATWDGDWLLDGHPVRRGAHVGQNIG